MIDPLTVIILVALFGVSPSVPTLIPVSPPLVLHFACDDGTRLVVSYPTPELAALTWNHDTTLMLDRDVSAGGGRYVGNGWQWWAKGMGHGMLTPLAPGEDMADAAGTSCAITP